MPLAKANPTPPVRYIEAEVLPPPALTDLPPADKVVGGGETADGVPFLVRASDGSTVELATGTKPRTAAKADASSFRELGSASPSPFTSALRQDANRDLAGQKGIAKYREMKRTSAAIRSSLRMVKTPIESARWDVLPGADTPIAKKQADFVREVLFNSLDVTWAQTLADILTMLEYGWSILHKVYIKEVGTGNGARIVLAKLAPRHPLDVEHVQYDAFGSPEAVWFYPAGAYEMRTDGGISPIGNAGNANIDVPMARLVVFTLDGEAGDIQGTSLLRSAYGHWMIQNALMRIDAIQKERHSLGIPVITLPPGAKDTDLALAEEIGRNLRANERAHVVLPDPNWNLEWAKLSGQPVDPRDSLEWHTNQIKANVLWTGESDNEYDLFMKSVRYIADRVADTINKWVVRELIDFNWATTKPGTYPRVTARWIGEFEDNRTRSFAIRNLVGADLITPDEVLEAQLRRELDLPMADLATRRVVEAPQNPNDPEANGTDQNGDKAPAGTNTRGEATTKEDKAGTAASQGGSQQRGQKAGKPRQGSPPSGRQAKNAGTDRSGGA
jgi:hypothetical protein